MVEIIERGETILECDLRENKTRLALHVAEVCSEYYVDHVDAIGPTVAYGTQLVAFVDVHVNMELKLTVQLFVYEEELFAHLSQFSERWASTIRACTQLEIVRATD